MKLLNKTRQLEVLLRKQISTGTWSKGERIPSEDSLMSEFGVSRPSMREALNTLVSEGIIERRHGSGTYIKRVPVGRIAVFARLENITSQSGYWHRDMILKVSEYCQGENLKAELLVVHGNDIDEIEHSFERCLQFLPMSEFEGAIILTPLPGTDELLTALEIPYVSVTSGVCGDGSSIVLDYLQMSRQMKKCMQEHGYGDYVVMHVADPPNKIDSRLNVCLRNCLDILTDGDNSRLLSSPGIDQARDLFIDWWKRPQRSQSIVFFDDALCEICCKSIWENNIQIPDDLAILTHANINKEFILPVSPFRVGFCAEEAAQLAWDLLNNERVGGKRQERVIQPVLFVGNSL